MKSLLSFLIVFGAFSFSYASEAKPYAKCNTQGDDTKEMGISFFSGTWAEALQKSKDEKKIIFLDAYATWCGPCKRMASLTFTDEAVGLFFNEHFINYKMDMENHAEGPRLSRKYSLTAYPTLYFINSDESIAHQVLGYQDPAKLIAAGETVVGVSK